MNVKCPEWEEVNKNEYKGYWVYVELKNGKPSEHSLQLIGKARELADKLGTYVGALTFGGGKDEDLPRLLYSYGVDKMFIIKLRNVDKYTPIVYGKAIAFIVHKYRPDAILFPGAGRGRELAPYVAALLRTGITADCVDLDVDVSTGDLIQFKPTFGGNIIAEIRIPNRRPQIVTIRKNAFPTPDPHREGEAEVIVEEVELKDERLRQIDSRKVEIREERPLEASDIVIGVGRGVGGRDGLELISKLAELLNAAIGGTKRAVDAGLIPPERMIGETGKYVRPRLYIGIGISGALQHVVGILNARVIVAINTDENAPIFQFADYGIIGDYREVVKELIRLIAEKRKVVTGL